MLNALILVDRADRLAHAALKLIEQVCSFFMVLLLHRARVERSQRLSLVILVKVASINRDKDVAHVVFRQIIDYGTIIGLLAGCEVVRVGGANLLGEVCYYQQVELANK